MDRKEKIKPYYDLEKRTFSFARNARLFTKRIPKTIESFEDSKQLVRSSGSVGANYIEANESVSKKDFCHRIKICRKEAKESSYWLNLINIDDNKELYDDKQKLIKESIELAKIFSAIIQKSQ